jgi:hypothetical protein
VVTADAAIARDWTTSPAILDLPTFTTLYALSDIHGGYDRLVALLARHGLIAAAPATPAAATWTGGDATLVVVGDLIDKGSQSLAVLDLVRALQASAPDHGGRVIALYGNHEAEFLVDATNSKASAFDDELAAQGIDPRTIASGRDDRGVWLRQWPFGARVERWFFAHAGSTAGRTLAEEEDLLRAAITAHDFNDPAIVGDASLLEARDWWQPAGVAQADLAALGVDHIVFGHTPSALGPSGAIAIDTSGALFRIDVGMSPAVDDSKGALLRITHDGADEVATELRADGTTRALWRGPR